MGWTADHLALPAEWLESANAGCSHFLLGTSHLHLGNRNRCLFLILCALVAVVPAPPLATSSSKISDCSLLARVGERSPQPWQVSLYWWGARHQCPGCSLLAVLAGVQEQRGSGALGISVALCFPSVSDTGKAEMPLAQSTSQLGCCVGRVAGQSHSLCSLLSCSG